MAGFWIVTMGLLVVIILLIIYAIIQLMTILSIIFSAVSLNKSKKYTALNGNYNFKSVKRFHSAAITFFVFGCLGFCFEGLMAFAYFFEAEEQTAGETVFMLLVLAKYGALFTLGIMAFKKFTPAAVLNKSLCAYYASTGQGYSYQSPYRGNPGGNAQQGNYYAGQYPNGGGNFGSPQQGGYPQNGSYANYTPANNAPPPNYQAAPSGTSGFEGNHAAANGVPAPIPVVVTDPVKQAQIAADKSAQSFSTGENDKDNGSTAFDGANKREGVQTQQGQNTDIFTASTEKRCSKCGVVNEEKSKFCTFCGEKL